ncbi:putative multidrug resistance protein [Azorhizobium oxalatiphilum]|uniref:Guanidinium exporter n=1 Tax=Azorhizobium oxalatiphilum TaxID=980631 RepID=A0A917FIR6_9HYPH|nr:multidrug efflux SMR transporter [Azorhizobium oxalatiphilum]GGF83088.1 putative multidrug resistance protein [Azorhizobium oxalatiphilum]
MAWIILFGAGLMEVGWAIGLKYAEGFTKLWPSVFTLVSAGISLVLLSIAARDLPIGTAYAVWAGIGMVGTVAVGILFLGESADVMRLVSILLIGVGIAGLKLATPH